MSQKKKEEKKKKGYLPAGLILGTLGVASAGAGVIIYVTHPEEKPTEYCTVTFDPNGGELDGTKLRVKEGTRFGSIAVPRVIKSPEFKQLTGWLHDGTVPVTDDYIFTKSQVIKANWNDSGMSEISFVANGDDGIDFDGLTTFAVKDNTQFGLINKPIASKESSGDIVYRFMGWKYVSNDQPVKDEDKIQGKTSVYPWFSESKDVEFINLTFSRMPGTEPKGVETTFNGIKDSFSTDIDKKLKWGEINKPIPKKTETTIVGTETIVTEYEFLGWFKKDAGGNYQEITDSETTFLDGDEIYAKFDEAPESLDSSYYVKDSNGTVGMIVNGTESEGPIQIVSKDPASGEIITHNPIPRETFNQQVYLGKKVTSISPNFLRGCSKFNSPIVIPNTVTYIGSGFLYGCESFNQPITMPTTVGSIGKCFLYGCIKMNSAIKLNEGMYTIDDYFMTGCSVFNQNLAIPTTIISIGNSFMSYCAVFNNGLNNPSFSIPSGLEYLGSDFLSECGTFNRDLSFVNCSKLTAFPSTFLYQSTSYNSKITLPTSIKTIGSNFCAWTDNNPNLSDNFGSNATYPLTELTTIGDSFMNKTTYNRNLILTNTKLTSIGGNFLRNDSTFDSRLAIPNSVTSFGDSVLYGCTGFTNSQNDFKIPTNLKTIGDEFMYLCISFPSKLIIPSGVTHVGNYFLNSCYSITAIEINCPASSFDQPTGNDKSFCQYYEGYYWYEAGIIVSGSTAQEIINKFGYLEGDYYANDPGRYLH